MNVTAKDKVLIGSISHSMHYPLPFAFRQRKELQIISVRGNIQFNAHVSFRTEQNRPSIVNCNPSNCKF
jgi:hypothetical protein